MMLKPLGGHGVPKWPREWARDPRGCPAEGNDDARETLRKQWFGGQAPLKTVVFMYILHMRSKRYVDCGFVDMGAFFEAMS